MDDEAYKESENHEGWLKGWNHYYANKGQYLDNSFRENNKYY